MEKKKANLVDGGGWEEHEGYLIGDEEGLRNPINACKKAITSGEYSDPNLGHYLGVKKLDPRWFDENYSANSRWANIAITLIFIAIIFLIVMGFKTVISWF